MNLVIDSYLYLYFEWYRTMFASNSNEPYHTSIVNGLIFNQVISKKSEHGGEKLTRLLSKMNRLMMQAFVLEGADRPCDKVNEGVDEIFTCC